MRADARKRLHPGVPPDVLLARLEFELAGAVLLLKAGRIEEATQAIDRCLDLGKQIREA